MVTSFTRIVVVLSFLRTAIGTQQAPPNMVMISLALFLTAFAMAPTLERSYEEGIAPLLAEQIDEQEPITPTAAPLPQSIIPHVPYPHLPFFLPLSLAGPLASHPQ